MKYNEHLHLGVLWNSHTIMARWLASLPMLLTSSSWFLDPDLYQTNNTYAPLSFSLWNVPLYTNSPISPIFISTFRGFSWRLYETWPWLVAKTNMWWQQKVISWCRFGWGSVKKLGYNPHTEFCYQEEPKIMNWSSLSHQQKAGRYEWYKVPSHNNPVTI